MESFLIRTLLLLVIAVQLSAIVVIKPREVGENPGLTGEIVGAFDTKRGNTETDDYSAAFDLQYDSNASYLVWGIVTAAYGEASGVKNTNNVYGHLRYIENIRGQKLAAEVFAQIEEDEFKSIKDRTLFGGGLRAKLLRPKAGWGGLFFGLGAFLEYVGYSTGVDPAERNVRFNSYIAYALSMANDSKLILYTYYQPKVNAFGDYLTSASATLEIRLYRQLYLGFVAAYAHDSRPAIGVKKDDFSQKTLLKYKF
jgi:hypothetical protein